ncbi:unnamed protein product, partial [Closterium sp. Naga37s-1]
GGCLWFEDLTALPHGVLGWVLPLSIAGSFYSSLQVMMPLHKMGVHTASDKAMLAYRTFLEFLTLPTLYAALNVPQAVHVYWLTNNTFTLAQALALRSPTIRQALGLPTIAQMQAMQQQHARTITAAAAAAASKGAGSSDGTSPGGTGSVGQLVSEQEIARLTDPHALLVAAAQLKAAGSVDLAACALRRVLEIDQSASSAWLGLGQMHSGAGRWVEAAECFSQAINHSKERADVAVQLAAHLGAGVALAQQSRPLEAKALLQVAAEMSRPLEAKALLQVAAETVLKGEQKRDPLNRRRHAQAMLALASLLSADGNRSEAKKWVVAAADYDPSVLDTFGQELEGEEEERKGVELEGEEEEVGGVVQGKARELEGEEEEEEEEEEEGVVQGRGRIITRLCRVFNPLMIDLLPYSHPLLHSLPPDLSLASLHLSFTSTSPLPCPVASPFSFPPTSTHRPPSPPLTPPASPPPGSPHLPVFPPADEYEQRGHRDMKTSSLAIVLCLNIGMKTSSVAIVLCLNIGVDPPDVIKISPCARVECWIDPFSMQAQKALDSIGKNLQAQYERWQPKARYKVQLDPTVEALKKLCLTCRRNAKAERVLFHYNGHGVPKPTGNGEIWVFNKTYTQYIPLSVYELDSWLATPSIYVFDCSAAGIIINAFVERPDWALAAPSSPLASPTAASREAAAAATAAAATAAGMRDRILLAACGPEEILPQPSDLPADLFTACLTTPIKIALRWFCSRSLLRDSLDPEMVERIPGRQSERKTALGELNWIFTAVTDTIAWNTLPTHLFQRLFRQDLLVASLFRNFLLAERVMRASGCTPVSYPRLPPTHQHHLWHAWDMAAEMCLAQLPTLLADPNAEFQPSSFFSQQLMAFEVCLEHGSDKKRPPEQLPIVLQVLLSHSHRLRALVLLGRFLDMGPWAVDLALSVGIFPYVLKLLQTSAVELRQILVFIWTKILALDKSCQVDLVRDGGHMYFIKCLETHEPYSSDPRERATVAFQRAMAAFVLALICDGHPKGHQACLQAGLIPLCLMHIQAAPPAEPLLLQWLCLCVGKLWGGAPEAQAAALVQHRAPQILSPLLSEPQPEHQPLEAQAAAPAQHCVSQILSLLLSEPQPKRHGQQQHWVNTLPLRFSPRYSQSPSQSLSASAPDLSFLRGTAEAASGSPGRVLGMPPGDVTISRQTLAQIGSSVAAAATSLNAAAAAAAAAAAGAGGGVGGSGGGGGGMGGGGMGYDAFMMPMVVPGMGGVGGNMAAGGGLAQSASFSNLTRSSSRDAGTVIITGAGAGVAGGGGAIGTPNLSLAAAAAVGAAGPVGLPGLGGVGGGMGHHHGLMSPAMSPRVPSPLAAGLAPAITRSTSWVAPLNAPHPMGSWRQLAAPQLAMSPSAAAASGFLQARDPFGLVARDSLGLPPMLAAGSGMQARDSGMRRVMTAVDFSSSQQQQQQQQQQRQMGVMGNGEILGGVHVLSSVTGGGYPPLRPNHAAVSSDSLAHPSNPPAHTTPATRSQNPNSTSSSSSSSQPSTASTAAPAAAPATAAAAAPVASSAAAAGGLPAAGYASIPNPASGTAAAPAAAGFSGSGSAGTTGGPSGLGIPPSLSAPLSASFSASLLDPFLSLDAAAAAQAKPVPKSGLYAWSCGHLSRPLLEAVCDAEAETRRAAREKRAVEGVAECRRATVSKVSDQIASFDTESDMMTEAVLLHPFLPLVCIADENEVVRIWNYEEGLTVSTFDNQTGGGGGADGHKGVSQLCLLNELDDTLLLVASMSQLCLLNELDDTLLLVASSKNSASGGAISLFASTHKGRTGAVVEWQQLMGYLYASGEISSILVWDLDRELLAHSVPTECDSAVTALGSSVVQPSYVAAGCDDGSVRLFDIRSQPRAQLVCGTHHHSHRVAGIAFHPASTAAVAPHPPHTATAPHPSPLAGSCAARTITRIGSRELPSTPRALPHLKYVLSNRVKKQFIFSHFHL